MPSSSSDHRPSDITGRVFAVRRKGFDTDEVRAYLGQLAEIISRLTAERDSARASISDLEAEAAARPEIDEDQLTEVLGEETARVLSSARKAAVEMKERAEENVARMLREAAEEAGATRRGAEADAARVRDEAQEVRDSADEARRQAEADAEAETARRLEAADAEATERREASEAERAAATEAAAAMRAEAEAEAESTRARADEANQARQAEAERTAAAARAAAEVEAETIRAAAHDEAAAIRATAQHDEEQSRASGEELLSEAQRVRERMLADLARRRKAAKVQLEQLEGARENLLESYEAVRRSLDEATDGLRTALPRARSAAETARLRAEAEAADTVPSLEAQISAARAAGLPLVAPDPSGTTPATALWGPPDVEGPSDADLDVPKAGTNGAGADASEGDAGPAGEGVDELFARLKASREVAASESAEEPEAAPAKSSDPGTTSEDATPSEATAAEPTAGDEPTAEMPAVSDDASGPDDAARAGEPASADGESGEPGADEEEDEEADDDETGLLDMFERRDGAIEPVEGRIARRLKRVLADEQGLVLDAVRRQSGAPDLDDILSLDDQIASYASVVADDLLAAAEEGAAFEGAALPPSTKIDDLAHELARSLANVVRPRVERCFESGDDADDTSDRLRATYREWKTDRLVESTRHVVLGAFGRGQSAVRPNGAPVRWTPDPASPACPDCEDDALAGPVPSGDPFPTGHTHPPAHPGCRCLVVAERVAAPA